MNIEISQKEYEKFLNWDDAMMYCQLVIIDGKNDWRLPTKDELNDIYHSDNDFCEMFYWSSTIGDDNKVWHQNMNSGNLYQDNKKPHHLYVRPVRTIE